MIARLEVTRGSLTEYPLAEKVCGGWQNGVMFYPDAEVTKVTPLIFRNETPTDDDQDVLAQIVCRALEHQDGGEECEVEPSTECPQPCVHLSQHDAREGRTCAEHPCTCPEPQGEPSSAQEAIRVASPDTWGWDACIVCGSKDVTDRGMMVLFSAKDGVYVSRVAWCDQSQECRDDLRQAGASMLTDQDAKSIDAALRAAGGVR